MNRPAVAFAETSLRLLGLQSQLDHELAALTAIIPDRINWGHVGTLREAEAKLAGLIAFLKVNAQ